MRKIITVLLFLLIFISNTSNAIAQTTTPTAQSGDSTDSQDQTFTTDPPQTPTSDRKDYYITDFTPSVKVTFPGLDPNGEYKFCFRTDYCIGDPQLFALSTDKFLAALTQLGIKPDQMNSDRLDDNKGNQHARQRSDGSPLLGSDNSITVCGTGNDDLYYNDECNSPYPPEKDGPHYFHAGNFYIITVYQQQDNNSNDVAIARAGFYVNHGTPTITVVPSSVSTNGVKFTVSIAQNVIRPGGNNRNDYEVTLVNPGYRKSECDWVGDSHNPRTFEFPLPPGAIQHYVDPDSADLVKNGYTVPGSYTFSINEQNAEGGLHMNDCSGGFTYESFVCTVTNKGTATCKDGVVDPKDEDARQLLSLLNIINGNNGDSASLPCGDSQTVTDPSKCKELDTAIGPIQLDVVGFVSRLFSIVLSIAGLGALLLIIYSGYRLLLSRGNKEVVQGARETLTSAIVGLLFIVFSLVLLSVIAGDILKIPGFGP